MKKLLHKQSSDASHWVGDGFYVKTLFTYNDLAKEISPFLLLDYASPLEFKPTEHRRGVGEHPHRGFETVTIVYSGEVEHLDSAGGGGKIGPGDVQWMTAASGLVHEEKHSHAFTKNGGLFEMVQLWVNLPAKDKMSPPRYQGIKNQDIPQIQLNNSSGTLRVIAGSYQGQRGPAQTFTPIEMWDLRLHANKTQQLSIPSGFTTVLFLLSGELKINSTDFLNSAELAILDKTESDFMLTAITDCKVLLLAGEPINEPIAGRGPFVMNTWPEIRQAYDDYESGRMGHLK